MRIHGRSRHAGVLLAGLCAGLIALLGPTGCGGSEAPEPGPEPEPPGAVEAPEPETGSEPSGERANGKKENDRKDAGPDREGKEEVVATPPERIAERRSRRIYRDYIAAINTSDGPALCALLAPGSVETLDPPRKASAGCARSLTASIGYADPRGFPAWEETILSSIDSVRATPTSTQITATIVTRFADRDQPSIESDIAYTELSGGEWRLVKASGALYRAVGKPDIPPSVISPP